jgi:hypothetical protein
MNGLTVQQQTALTDGALRLLGQTLRTERCRNVGVEKGRNVVCQLPEHDDNTSHWAHDPVMGDVTWVDVPRIG